MREIRLRTLLVDDLPAIRRIDAATQREYRGPQWDEYSPQWDEYSNDTQAQLLCYPDEIRGEAATEFSIVALDGDEIVAFLLAFREPLADQRRIYVDGIAVLPQFRRFGVASNLYERLVTAAKQAGIKRITTRISLDNKLSLRLHGSVGFRLLECVEATLDI